MTKVPKIVAERLQAAIVTTLHPDADLLTAFSERTLAERERSSVLEHLARCGECREVVALALPAEEAAVVEMRPARNAWLTWPRMRWALAVAGVVTVASFSLVQYQRMSHPKSVAHLYDSAPATRQEEARNQGVSLPPAAEAPREAKKAAPPTPVPSSPAMADSEGKEFDRLDRFSKLEKAPKDKAVVGGVLGQRNIVHGQALAHGPKMPTQFQQNSQWNSNANNNYNYAVQAQSQAPAAAPPPAIGDQQASSQLVVMPPASSPAAQPGRVTNQKLDVDSLAVAGRSTAPLQSTGSDTGTEIARAKPATSANAPQPQAAEAFAMAPEGSNFSPSGALAPESAQWSINSAGGLQRSIDQGRTWQDIDVNTSYGRGAGMGLQMAMKSRDKTSGKNKADLNEKPIVFRAVAANGPDVWAGGSEGNLYHSTDSGVHWIRMVPSWRGIDLTGDIVNLQFSDPQHGRIVTSAAEIWITMDAGQTWEKH